MAERIESGAPEMGGNDTISGDGAGDFIIGGMADDEISGDDGDDVIIGDNGVIVRSDGSGEENDLWTTDPEQGGSDKITGDDGWDVILGGSGGSDLAEEGGGDEITGDDTPETTVIEHTEHVQLAIPFVDPRQLSLPGILDCDGTANTRT